MTVKGTTGEKWNIRPRLEADDFDGEGISKELRERITQMTPWELRRCIAVSAHEYVARFDGSPESILAAIDEARKGAETGYCDAVEQERRRPEKG